MLLELTPIEKRKLIKSLKRDWDEFVLTADDEDGCVVNSMVSLRYVVYSSPPCEEKTIDSILPTKFTLYDFMQHITTSLADDETVELYSKDGYPLHNNCITNSGIL